MTINWKIGFFVFCGLAAFVMLGLNSRAESDTFAADDLEPLPLYCSVVDPMSACFQGYGGFIFWEPL